MCPTGSTSQKQNRDGKGELTEIVRNEQAKQEESKSGKKRWREREGERVEIKRMHVNRVSCDFFEAISPMAECDCCAFWCLCSPSTVSGFGENILFDTDADLASLSKKRHVLFVESQEEMNISGTVEKRFQHPGKRFAGSSTEVNFGGLHKTERLLKNEAQLGQK